FVRGKEVGHLIAFFHSAEASGGFDDISTGADSELCLDLVPVVADVVPCLVLGLALAEEAGKESPTVLIAHLPGDGVVERARHQPRQAEAGQRAQGLGLEIGVGPIFACREEAVIERGVAMSCRDTESGFGEYRIELRIRKAYGRIGAVSDLGGFSEDRRVSGVAEDLEELGAKLLAVEGLAFLRAAERTVDRLELTANHSIEP